MTNLFSLLPDPAVLVGIAAALIVVAVIAKKAIHRQGWHNAAAQRLGTKPRK